MPELEEAVMRLGEAAYNARVARDFILRDLRNLYSDEEIAERMGRTPWAPEMIEAVKSDLERGRLEIRDAKEVCSRRGCMDVARFLERVDDYYKAEGAKAKALRDIEREVVG